MLPVFGTTIVSTTSHHCDMEDGMGNRGPCGGLEIRNVGIRERAAEQLHV